MSHDNFRHGAYHDGVPQTFQFFELVRERFLDGVDESALQINKTVKSGSDLQGALEDTLSRAGLDLDLRRADAVDRLVDIIQLAYEAAESVGVDSQTLEALRYQKATRQGTYSAGVYLRAIMVDPETTPELSNDLLNQPNRYPRVPDQAVLRTVSLPQLADD